MRALGCADAVVSVLNREVLDSYARRAIHGNRVLSAAIDRSAIPPCQREVLCRDRDRSRTCSREYKCFAGQREVNGGLERNSAVTVKRNGGKGGRTCECQHRDCGFE